MDENEVVEYVETPSEVNEHISDDGPCANCKEKDCENKCPLDGSL